MERECITLVKSRLFNLHRNKYVKERISIPLVNICNIEILSILKSMNWEVLEKKEDITPCEISDWIISCRKIGKSWFSRKSKPIFQLGFQWARDSTGRIQASYWLEYSIENNPMNAP